MFFELVGTLMAGVAAGLLVWALNRKLNGRLPGWLMPTAAGAAMLLTAISNEYGWYERTIASLPEGFIVADVVEDPSLYRPWTYAVPFASRFVAVDQTSIRRHDSHPNQRIVDVYFYGRWSRLASAPVMFDCAAARRANMNAGVEFGNNGEILNAAWIELTRSDPVLKTACAGV